MQTRTLLSRATLALLPLAALGALAWTPADHGSRIAGTFSAQFTGMQTQEVGDAPGHAIALARSQGTNRNTGPTDFMDGAEIVNVETNDLVQGNGTHQGYITFSQGGETTISRWSGKVTTVLGPDQRPATTVEGSWTTIAGTGRYAAAKGSGRYKGRMLSEKEISVDWSGELSGVKVAAR